MENAGHSSGPNALAEHGHEHGHDHGPSGGRHEYTAAEQREELNHYREIIRSYQWYIYYSLSWIAKLEKNWTRVPPHQQALIPRWRDRIAHLQIASRVNQDFINLLIAEEDIFEDRKMSHKLDGPDMPAPPPSAANMEKVRDWSAEGREERERCYAPILREISDHFPLTRHPNYSVRVLVPGAGLGRLVHDIAKMGYAAQGNEFSYFMLIASNFILNRATEVDSIEIYPWIHSTSNVLSLGDQFRKVNIPDVCPQDLPVGVDFSMTAGDFVEVYQDQVAQWDCVATCFFMDTAKNIMEYVETIARVLKPGGVWINLGPLLYHWAEMEEEYSIEISYQELREVIRDYGFNIEKEEMRKCTYTSNMRSMLQNVYNCVFFVAIKSAASGPLSPGSTSSRANE